MEEQWCCSTSDLKIEMKNSYTRVSGTTQLTEDLQGFAIALTLPPAFHVYNKLNALRGNVVGGRGDLRVTAGAQTPVVYFRVTYYGNNLQESSYTINENNVVKFCIGDQDTQT